jgi:predicted ester cyclase
MVLASPRPRSGARPDRVIPGTAMPIEENKTIVRRFAEEIWNAGQLDMLDGLVATDLVRNDMPIGREGIAGIVAMLRAALPDLAGTTVELVADGDRVEWRYARRGTHTGGALFGVAPTGKVVRWTGTATLRLAGGQIAEIADSVDVLAISRRLT